MVSNRPGLPVKPGSMGKPVHGIQAEILSDNGEPLLTNQPGHLCFKPGWPSMLLSYLNNEGAFRQKFRFNFFHTGDTAYRDKDGYIWFTGRSDDLIKTAGHLISPFEIESSLLEIEEIAEAGVIGAPDAILFEKVVAFVKLKKGSTWTEDLEIKIRLHVSNRVSTFAAPREFFVVDQVPKNKSGKIMRRVLRARYQGKDAGDLSTLDI
jgi:acetyl-CoA synthetase